MPLTDRLSGLCPRDKFSFILWFVCSLSLSLSHTHTHTLFLLSITILLLHYFTLFPYISFHFTLFLSISFHLLLFSFYSIHSLSLCLSLFLSLFRWFLFYAMYFTHLSHGQIESGSRLLAIFYTWTFKKKKKLGHSKKPIPVFLSLFRSSVGDHLSPLASQFKF